MATRTSGGGGIVAGRGDVVGVDIMMDGRTMTTTMAIGCGL